MYVYCTSLHIITPLFEFYCGVVIGCVFRFRVMVECGRLQISSDSFLGCNSISCTGFFLMSAYTRKHPVCSAEVGRFQRPTRQRNSRKGGQGRKKRISFLISGCGGVAAGCPEGAASAEHVARLASRCGILFLDLRKRG